MSILASRYSCSKILDPHLFHIWIRRVYSCKPMFGSESPAQPITSKALLHPRKKYMVRCKRNSVSNRDNCVVSWTLKT